MIGETDSTTIAKRARISAIKMVHKANASHIGSSLSIIDIAAVIVSNCQLSERIESGNDFVISKGHAAAGIYAVLAEAGYIPYEWLDNYSGDNAFLGGHITSTNVKVLGLSTGSLGHGLPFALGRAYARKMKSIDTNSYVVLSDGECDEGSNWEAALLAGHLKLNNLSVVIDRNGLQSLAATEETVMLEPLVDKWKAFNWDVQECDGHDHKELAAAIFRVSEKPRMTIANTIKGYGVSFMKNSVKWHYRAPNKEEMLAAIAELD